MTDSSMNFGPAWIRNLRSEGTTGGGSGGGTRYQLAEHRSPNIISNPLDFQSDTILNCAVISRYGREEMLALFDKSVKPPLSLIPFKTLYSEPTLTPLALLPNTEEERNWQTRPATISGPSRGRGGSLDRGGRSRGRGGYQPYGRGTGAYDSGWGNGEQPDWTPRKDFNPRTSSTDNWRRVRHPSEEDDGWRNISTGRPAQEKWGRSTSWRGDGDAEERAGPPERGGRATWNEMNRGGPPRRSWDNEDHLPEWANENPTEGGGTFDERGAFHGSDDEQSRNGVARRELHKSTSQQHITSKDHHQHHPTLTSSKSAVALNRPHDPDHGDLIMAESELHNQQQQQQQPKEHNKNTPEKEKPRKNLDKIDIRDDCNREDDYPKSRESNGLQSSNFDRVEEEFARLQEDLVLKLVVDEEMIRKPPNALPFDPQQNLQQPPPNLVQPQAQEKWYYQDPQGTRQGPFLNLEMAEWYKAGYFSETLHVMRECDERYFLLGELINLCGGENPFLSGVRFPILKNDKVVPDNEMLSYQYMSQQQMAFKQQIAMRNLSEPWSALTHQQQELATQRLMMQPQQLPHDLQFMPPQPPANPLMFMINQMQQGNKLPGSVLDPKSAGNVPNQMDPLLMQMGGVHPLQNRLQAPGMHNHLPPANMGGPPENYQQNPGLAPLPGLQHGGLPAGLQSAKRPMVDAPNPESDPIGNFLKQFHQQRPQPQQQQQQQQIPVEAMWQQKQQQQQQQQFTVPPPPPPVVGGGNQPPQWGQPPEMPMSMWDLQQPSMSPQHNSHMNEDDVKKQQQQQQQHQQHHDKEARHKEESQKELKKRKELEEKLAKKDAEEKRKQEQRKQEVDKKSAEDKRKKEEERMRKELEKAKKEAEDKRMRELDEKRRQKEARKAEEEYRKKSDEMKKIEEDKMRKLAKEREEKMAELARAQQAQSMKVSKQAPWSQSNSSHGMSLTDIQKAEKEKRAQEAAMILKQQLLQEQQQQQQQTEKPSGMQLSWAKKPVEPRKVKSFAEIQAEEQERLAKLAAEARLAALQKEKDAPSVPSSAGNIWNGQSLTWANASSTSQWPANSGGFWDDPVKTSTKPSTVSKSNSTSAMTSTVKQQQQQQQPPKAKVPKVKKDEAPKTVNNNNNAANDEFMSWCNKTLSAISTDVDIPTFICFLRDIESAYDVRDYCKDYLGDSAATQQFATNFLEKRRSFKPRHNAHKDDMCSPAPAITPSTQHSTEFQEVKGKNKKNKRSKMLKVDARILGFNVTSAPDRINVGDRDYGDNS